MDLRMHLLSEQAATDQSDSLYNNSSVSSTTSTNTNMMSVSSPPGMQPTTLTPLQKKSPLLTSLMEGSAVTTLQGMSQTANIASQVWHWHPMSTSTTMVHQPPVLTIQSPMSRQSHVPPGQQMMPQQQQQHASSTMVNSMGNQPMPPMTQTSIHQAVSQAVSSSPTYTPNIMTVPTQQQQIQMTSNQGLTVSQGMMQQHQPQTCLRNGCPNPAVDSPDWDREYCSNECVVSHCRDVFTAWVASRQATNSYASVK